MPLAITRNRHAVLKKMAESDTALVSRDFADIATFHSGRWEWALPILRKLEQAGLVSAEGARTHKGQAFRITETGRSWLSEPMQTVKRNGKLSDGMRNELLSIASAQARGFPYEAISRRATHEALEARGLVSVERRKSGWRHMRLTRKGMEVYREVFGKEPIIAPEIPI